MPSEYADNKVRRDDLRAGNSKLSLEDLGHRPAPFMGLAITMVGISAVVSMLVIYRITRRRAKAVAGAENIAVQNVDHSSSAPSSPAAAAAAAAKVGIPGVLSCLATGDKGGQEVRDLCALGLPPLQVGTATSGLRGVRNGFLGSLLDHLASFFRKPFVVDQLFGI